MKHSVLTELVSLSFFVMEKFMYLVDARSLALELSVYSDAFPQLSSITAVVTRRMHRMGFPLTSQ